jgi:signal transduction histidine kinase
MQRLSRPDPVSNRNTIIMGKFAEWKLGTTVGIFDGLDFPIESSGKKFSSAEEYYMWEHGWHGLDQYVAAYRRLRDLFGPSTYAECGASVTRFQSWGIIDDTKYMVMGVKGGLENLPELNENFNDIKDFIIVKPPYFDEKEKRVKATYILRFHDDQDPHKDYVSDPHIQNILKQIPCVFGLAPADVKQPLLPYDLARLCEEEPEFRRLDLDPKIDGDILYIRDPISQKERMLGKRVVFEEEDLSVRNKYLCGDPILLGKYREWNHNEESQYTGFLLDGPLKTKETMFFPAGTIIGAPYFVIDFESDKEGSTLRSFYHAILFKMKGEKAKKKSLLEAISQVSNESKEKAQAYARLEEYSERLEFMVEERTKELRANQAKLLKSEKRILEHRITGGFAHEMRNALAGAQLEFKTTLNYKDQGKSSAQILKDSATGLLKNISLIHEKYEIPREEIASLVLPELKIIAEIGEHLSHIHTGVSSDLNRALSITTQIREYSKMSEFRPGDAEVDMVAMLKGYGDRYRQDFERIGIKYSVLGLEKAIVKADDIHMNSIFSNLILNAKDALEESEHDRQKEIGITVDKDMAHEGFVVNISDNGPGISEENLNEIFEPFYSTKPTTGTGLGLGVVKRLIRLYDGRIDVKSKPGTGTKFSVMLPYNV